MAIVEKSTLPRYWEKRVLAAYLLMMGETWDSTASKVGRSHTTIAHWKNDKEWWDRAKQEAETRWLYDVKDASRRAVYRQINEGDGDLGLKVLERLDDRLIPKQKTDAEHSGTIDIVVRYADNNTRSDSSEATS